MLTVFTINSIVLILAIVASYKDKMWMYASQLVLTACYAVRYDYGNDYWQYYFLYLKSPAGIDLDIIEPGWTILNIICQPIGFFGMIILITAFEYYAVYHFIRLFVPKKYWWMAVFVFLFTFNFQLLGCSMLRQFLAMVILLYTIKPILQRNFLKFILILAVAMSIHQTSLIFLPVYFLGYGMPKLRNWKWIAIITGVFLLLLVFAIKYVEYFKLAALLFNQDRFENYLSWDEGSYSFTLAFDVLWLVLMMYLCPTNKARALVCTLAVFSYFFLPFSFVVVILLRLMLFFSFYMIFAMPNMFRAIRMEPVRYGLFAIYAILTIRRSYTSITGETYRDFFMNFHTIFSAPAWI